MQIAQDIAKKHGLRCLLHEKPFAGVNGSGKHDNWSVITNTGINLFNPGKNPEENKPFLAALACTIKAVDEYAEILRMSIASAGNDHRLGANEAPPAIISMFLGEELDKVVEDICTGKNLIMKKLDVLIQVFLLFQHSLKIIQIVTELHHLHLPETNLSSVQLVLHNL